MLYSYPDLLESSAEFIGILKAHRNWLIVGAAFVKSDTKNYSGKVFTVSSGSDDFILKHLVSKHSLWLSPSL